MNVLLIFFVFLIVNGNSMILSEELYPFREAAREMFYHGFNNYIENAFPADEIKPISCEGRYREGRGTLDDALGDFSLTLIDSLSSLVVFGDIRAFNESVLLVIRNVRFDSNVTVSVFETTIRVLGGLLSAHLLIKDLKLLNWYSSELLDLAVDLGNRLLPAFKTKTGIPYSRVNLRYGVEKNEISHTCTACAGTLVLEFGLLSRLTGDHIYERVALKALRALWNRRSELGLFGTIIDAQTGYWQELDSRIGAGTDSFYEYLFKSYLYFGGKEHYDMFKETYSQVLKYINHDNWYLPVDMHSGNTKYTWTDSLSAFWPGLQVIVGDVDQAIQAHSKFLSLWNKYSAVPERFDVIRGTSIQGINNYPLRPEFVESTYLLYRATKDPQYLEVGKNILKSLQHCRVKCGYASVSNVETFSLEDRMDSFFLSETCKYLYLLFDLDNFVNKENYLFTTEGHILPINLPWHKNSPDTIRDVCINERYMNTSDRITNDLRNYHLFFGNSYMKYQEKCFLRMDNYRLLVPRQDKNVQLSKSTYIINNIVTRTITLTYFFVGFLPFIIIRCITKIFLEES